MAPISFFEHYFPILLSIFVFIQVLKWQAATNLQHPVFILLDELCRLVGIAKFITENRSGKWNPVKIDR